VISEFNPAAETLTGYKREEAVGLPYRDILLFEGGSGEAPFDIPGGDPRTVTRELTLTTRGGQGVPVMLSAFALRDDAGAPLGGVMILRDLTPIKRLEKERRDMVNMFAHDLKTPVVGVAGLVRRLRQGKAGPVSPEQIKYLDIIGGEMEQLEKLIGKFLEFARLDLHLLTPVLDAVAVEEKCREVIILLRPLAEAKDIRLDAEFPPEALVVPADPLLFRRVLENLLGNAIKYSPPHAAVVLRVSADAEEVRFAVKDQGPGVPPQDLPHLFEFFFRGREASREQGFGVGLATVKRIVDAHRGRVWVETEPGKGSTFFFTLPRQARPE
jgi:PAS domain S-box-containing protein